MVLYHFNPKNNVFDVYCNSIQFNSVLFAKSQQQLPQCAFIYKTKSQTKRGIAFIVVSLYFILPF